MKNSAYKLIAGWHYTALTYFFSYLEPVCCSMSSSNCCLLKMKVKLLSCVQLFATPWTVAYQAPLSVGFSRQEYWSGLPFPFSGDLPDPGIEPGSPALQADALPSEPLHTDFSGGRSGGLVFPSLSEFSRVCCGPHSQSLWHSQQSRSRCFSGTLLLFQRSNRCQKTANFTPGPPCCPSSSFASALHQACPDGYFLAVLGRASHHDADIEKWIELFYVYKNNYIPQHVSDYLFIVWS